MSRTCQRTSNEKVKGNSSKFFSISCSNWQIGVVPGVGMAQGLIDNYLENSFVSITGIDTVDSKFINIFSETI